MEKDDIIIREAVIHILDSMVGMPVLSDSLLEMGPDLCDFLRNHIYKLLSGDDLKNCVFDTESSEVYAALRDFRDRRIAQTSHTRLLTLRTRFVDLRYTGLIPRESREGLQTGPRICGRTTCKQMARGENT